jgi:hypothetical protein
MGVLASVEVAELWQKRQDRVTPARTPGNRAPPIHLSVLPRPLPRKILAILPAWNPML